MAARGLLPILLRKLINATTACTSLTMVGGDSVSVPGFDGELYGSSGNKWVPLGDSKWELGCSENIAKKANEEFKKRTTLEFAIQSSQQSFVFVTPRRWASKAKWEFEKNNIGSWIKVLAIDADDLEAWLEAAPSVALWFAEEIGLGGDGIESLDKSFDRWRSQSSLSITSEALLTSRQQIAENLYQLIKSKKCATITIQADSREEAGAFVCAVLIANGLSGQSACVTQASGLRFVEKNPQIKVVILANEHTEATKPIVRDGVIYIALACQGDIKSQKNSGEHLLVLSRPLTQDFEKALVAIGEDAKDSARLARQTGRSWSVYRRLKAKDHLFSKPKWLKLEYSDCLVTVMLVGGWDEKK